jgi:peptide/nickel transport system permease protein
MLKLLARRIAGLGLTLLAVSALIFVVMDILPGDPASIMLGMSASPDTLAALRGDQVLLIDLIERPGWVRERLAEINQAFFTDRVDIDAGFGRVF